MPVRTSETRRGPWRGQLGLVLGMILLAQAEVDADLRVLRDGLTILSSRLILP